MQETKRVYFDILFYQKSPKSNLKGKHLRSYSLSNNNNNNMMLNFKSQRQSKNIIIFTTQEGSNNIHISIWIARVNTN